MRSITVTTLVLLSLLTLPFLPSGAPDAFAQGASTLAPRVWIQVDGAVEKVQGDWMTFKLEDGRRMMTDVSRMSQQERGALVAGARTTLYGYTDQRIGRFVAYFLPVESATASAPPSAGAAASTAAPSVVPAASPDARPWRLVHGRVDRIDADTLTLVTDSGRAITVDLREVEPANRAAVDRDDDVTVVGFHSGDLERVDARFIHRDATGRRAEAPSASRTR
jgi:hypothetical protein